MGNKSTAETALQGEAVSPADVKKHFQFNVEPDLQNFESKTVAIYDVSGLFNEAPAVNNVGLATVAADEIFTPGTIFLGIGVPNVYLAHVRGPKSLRIVAAKSLYREETKVVETGGRVQSGVFIVALNITKEEIDKMVEQAYKSEGSKNITCLNTSMQILSAAGFSAVGATLTSFKLPHEFLRMMLLGEFTPTLNGRKLQFAFVKTTKKTLPQYYQAVYEATLNTPFRHLFRSLDNDAAREERKKIAVKISAENETRFKELREKGIVNSGPKLAVLVSETSSLGAFFRSIWGSHVICKIQAAERPEFVEALQKLLPHTLKEFDRPKLDFFTKVKKNVMFNKNVVDMLRSHLANNFDRHEGFSQDSLLALLSGGNSEDEQKFNFVITSREIIVISNNIQFGFVDWVLSKHVLISGYSQDVRFAGELWREMSPTVVPANGKKYIIHLNSNSGTYRPTEEQLDNVVKIASMIFPDIEFRADKSFLLTEPPKDTTAPTSSSASTTTTSPAPEEDEVGWVALDEEEVNMSDEQEVDYARSQLGISGMVSLKTSHKQKPIGVFLSKFDPLTKHHESTIESALKSGAFETIVVVPSDVTAEVLHTPLLTRQNIINHRYYEDPRVLTFMAHSFTLKNNVLGWVSDIVKILRDCDYNPVSVFLAEDYLDKSKRGRLVSMVPGDKYLVLYGKEEEKEVKELPSVDPETKKPIVKFQFTKPPKSAEVREYLSKNQDKLFSNNGLLTDTEVALSDPVKQYIYKNQLYKSQMFAGNVTDAFRNVFGTGLGTLLGRVEAEDPVVTQKVKEKLAKAEIYY